MHCVSDTICSLKELSSAVDDILLHRPPEGVADIDAGVDQFRCPEYAWDMIRYLMVGQPTFILVKLSCARSFLLDCNISCFDLQWVLTIKSLQPASYFEHMSPAAVTDRNWNRSHYGSINSACRHVEKRSCMRLTLGLRGDDVVSVISQVVC